jgi:hypothetical protein
VSTADEIVASVYDSSARTVLERLGRSAGTVAHTFAAFSSGWVQDILRLQQEMEKFLLTAERAGVAGEEAYRLLDDAMEAAQSSPRPFRIEDAYDRLWQSTGVLAFYRSPAAISLGRQLNEDCFEDCSYSYGADTATFDSRPEHCWRCDARGAETDVGLCTSCHDDLRTP